MAFTFFFRDRHTLEHLTKLLTKKLEQFGSIKIWDAGCAMGQEPYTISIMLAEALSGDDFKKIKIIATDIDENNQFGKIIKEGIYPFDQLSRLPGGIIEKYFIKVDEKDNYKLVDKILNSLQFHKQDLLQYNPIDYNFDAVICKNVLLHFNHEQQMKVFEMYYNVLKPGGYLTMEQTQSIPVEMLTKFDKVLSDANIFQKV